MATIDQATQTQIANIERSSGRTFAEWVETVRVSGLEKHGEIVTMLKRDHGFTHGNANLVALRSREAGDEVQGDDALISSHYAGPNAALRSLYDRVIGEVRAFGPDVELAPKRTYVSLNRRVRITSLDEIDGEVLGFLREAYEGA